ncbi:MAG: hypothetical protein WCP12_03090 [bacterium]
MKRDIGLAWLELPLVPPSGGIEWQSAVAVGSLLRQGFHFRGYGYGG